MARSQTHTQRGMGLGFTSSMRGMDAVWKRVPWFGTLDSWFWCQALVHQTASTLACMGVALTLIYWKIHFFCKYQISDTGVSVVIRLNPLPLNLTGLERTIFFSSWILLFKYIKIAGGMKSHTWNFFVSAVLCTFVLNLVQLFSSLET